MKKTTKDIATKVKKAFDNSVPDMLDSILEKCNSEKGRIITMTEKKRHGKLIKSLVASAACLALILVGISGFVIYNKKNTVTTTVTIDVNPSIEIKVNEQERVLEVIPLNDDAIEVIGTMDFKGSSVELTVNAIVGSMFSKGYLDYASNSILLSIQSNDSSLYEKLTQEVNALMQNENFEGSVVSQMVTNNEELTAIAEKYNISVGKANLINTILELYPQKSLEELVAFTLSDLCYMLREDNYAETGIVINRIKNVKYIGEEAALEKLIKYYKSIGVGQQHIKDISVKLAVYKGTIVYEIRHRFEYHNGNFSANFNPTTRINAVTGEFADIYDSGPVENRLLEHWIDVPEGHFTIDDATKAIMEAYEITDSFNSVIFMESRWTLRIDETTDKNTTINDLDEIIKYYFTVNKDGWKYSVVFSSDNGEILETSRETHEDIIK